MRRSHSHRGGVTHMGRNRLIGWMLAVCFIALIPTTGAAQTAAVKSLMAALRADIEALGAPKVHKVSADTADAAVKSLMAALRADIEALGAPKVQGGDLYFGNTKVSADTADAVVKMLGGQASLFVKRGDQYVRVATTLKKEDGTSAVGTTLAANSPARAKLNNGEAYYGDATLFGKSYSTGYVPIKDASGAVIGAYFVGQNK